MPDDREQRIRSRAYALWEAAGRPEGREEEHWAQAERLVDAEGPSGEAAAKPGSPRRKSSSAARGELGEPAKPSPRPRRSTAKRPPE
ncbi:MAG: DUF2934 domain-containing protein [Rhizobiaceae bacterium]|nr:DUF2934 domain-containing protein [Rhizobiaceae bacterium]MCV0407518.1 DUF2934 domain-containing protein [Rhizobiaceae bacterium]